MVAEALGLSSGITADDDVVRTRSGQDDCDIGLSERAKAMFPYWLECKNQKTLSVPAWLQQVAEAQARRQDTRTPVIVFKQHRDSTPYAITPFKHFLRLATNQKKSLITGNCSACNTDMDLTEFMQPDGCTVTCPGCGTVMTFDSFTPQEEE